MGSRGWMRWDVKGWCSGCVGGLMARLCKSTDWMLYCPRMRGRE